MNRKSLLLVLLPIIIMATSCAPKRMYYWGDYSETLYGYRKYPNEETLLKHKQMLESIVEESNKGNARVPPGVYAELGYIYLKENNNKEAIKYFHLEEQIYPESKVFMQRLERAAELRETDNSSTDEKAPLEDEVKTKPDTGG